MNRKVILGLGAFIVLLLGYLLAPDQWPIKNYPVSNPTIIAFGDSLVKGVGSTGGNDFVSVLSRLLVTPVLNLGVSGNTTEDGIRRLDSVIAQKPGTVLVLLGGNDYLRRIPKLQTMANLETIITRLQDSGALVVLLGVRGGLLRDNYESDFKDVARRTGAAYVPNVLSGVYGDPNLMFDQIHPNDAGYQIIAEKVIRILRPLLSK